MKLKDFRTLDVVTFDNNTKGVVYERDPEPPLVVSLDTFTWCVINGDSQKGFHSSHGKIIKVETGLDVGRMCNAARARIFDWIKPRAIKWSYQKRASVKIGNTSAAVLDGTWTCEGVSGDISDAENVLELFTEPDKPKLQAYDLVHVGSQEDAYAAVLPSPDKHEGNFAIVYGRIILRKWIPSGTTEFVDTSDYIPDANKILRWDNVNYAFGWLNGGGDYMYQAKEIWARKQMVRIANSWDARRIGDIVKVGCQEVTMEQVEELIRVCKNTMPK